MVYIVLRGISYELGYWRRWSRIQGNAEPEGSGVVVAIIPVGCDTLVGGLGHTLSQSQPRGAWDVGAPI